MLRQPACLIPMVSAGRSVTFFQRKRGPTPGIYHKKLHFTKKNDNFAASCKQQPTTNYLSSIKKIAMKTNLQKKNRLCFLFFAYLMIATAIQAQIQIGSDIDGEAAGDHFGWSVSMPDAHTIAIGAPLNSGANASINTGHVQIYEWNGSQWVQKGTDIDGQTEESGQTGFSVSMPDVNTIGIGTPYSSNPDYSIGNIRVYTWDGTNWTQKGDAITNEVPTALGPYISMPDANTIAIGTPTDGGVGNFMGHVRIYQWDGTGWIQKGNPILGERLNDFTGFALSMPDSNTIAIGAPYDYPSGLSEEGQVRIYSWDGNDWVKKGDGINGGGVCESGWTVSMPDSNTVAIGARDAVDPILGTLRGRVRIYSWNGNQWLQKGSDIYGEAANDKSGWSVSMPDAYTLAVGAPFNAEAGPESGHVRIYTWDGTDWIQIGNDIDGEAPGDKSGWSVSMPDAQTVAIGAPFNDGSGEYAGHVRIYNLQNVATHEESLHRPNITLYQNKPNPFHEETVISFYLPPLNGYETKKQSVKLTITDAWGRPLKVFQIPYKPGYQNIKFSDPAIPGVMYCRLETTKQVLVRKMLKF